jgi:hypothetical protein
MSARIIQMEDVSKIIHQLQIGNLFVWRIPGDSGDRLGIEVVPAESTSPGSGACFTFRDVLRGSK